MLKNLFNKFMRKKQTTNEFKEYEEGDSINLDDFNRVEISLFVPYLDEFMSTVSSLKDVTLNHNDFVLIPYPTDIEKIAGDNPYLTASFYLLDLIDKYNLEIVADDDSRWVFIGNIYNKNPIKISSNIVLVFFENSKYSSTSIISN